MDKKNKLSIKLILAVIITISSIFLLGFKITEHKTPNEMYAVYLNGKKIGTVKSKDDFNKYINEQEEKLKQKYNVDKIYTPKGVEIKKVIKILVYKHSRSPFVNFMLPIILPFFLFVNRFFEKNQKKSRYMYLQ